MRFIKNGEIEKNKKDGEARKKPAQRNLINMERFVSFSCASVVKTSLANKVVLDVF